LFGILIYAFVRKHALGQTQRHHALNDIVARSFASAGIPVLKESFGVYRDSIKRPDGITLCHGSLEGL